MSLDDYKIVLYRNQPEGWVAEAPAIQGCYALMSTRGEALALYGRSRQRTTVPARRAARMAGAFEFQQATRVLRWFPRWGAYWRWSRSAAWSR